MRPSSGLPEPLAPDRCKQGMRWASVAAAVLILACGPVDNPALATLTPVTLSTAPPAHFKSAGSVVAIEGRSLRIRVDQGNLNEGIPLNGALIALRTDERTTFALRATRLADVHVGDHVTFAFDPRTLDPQDRSYLASVVGRL
jgi:hypothetical protein